jgi:hypothetical protein
MKSFKYSGFTFVPYGNITGKDSETKFRKLMFVYDPLDPLLNGKINYNYEGFYKTAGENSEDVYFVEETELYYVPTGGGICRIDVKEMNKYIRKTQQKF